MELAGSIPLTSLEMFETVKDLEKSYVLYVSTEDCGVCKSIYPKMMNTLKNFDVNVYSIDATEHQEIAGQLLVFSVPTIIVIDNKKEIYRESRFIQFEQFNNLCSNVWKEQI